MSLRRCFESVRTVRGVTLVCALTALPSLHCGSSDSNGGSSAGSGSTAGAAGSGGRASKGGAGGTSSAAGNSGAAGNAGAGSDDGGEGNSSNTAGASAAGSGGGGPDPGAVRSLLIVVGASGVMIWDDAAALDADVAPDAVLSGEVAGGRAVVVDDARLAVVTESHLVVFDAAAALASDAVPAALLDLPELSPSLGVARAAVDGQGDLWLTIDGSIALYPAFGSLGTGDLPQATFFHEWGQIASMTYSAVDDRLFAAQVSGAGILQLASAKAASDAVELESSWSDTSCWGTALADGRLYCAQSSAVSVWQDLSAAGPPGVTLTSGLDYPLLLEVVRDTLVVLDQGAQSVLLYQNASALTSDAEPDVRIEDVGFPVRGWLSHSNSLYLLTTRDGSRSVMIYDDVFGSPELRTELTASEGEDLWLLE